MQSSPTTSTAAAVAAKATTSSCCAARSAYPALKSRCWHRRWTAPGAGARLPQGGSRCWITSSGGWGRTRTTWWYDVLLYVGTSLLLLHQVVVRYKLFMYLISVLGSVVRPKWGRKTLSSSQRCRHWGVIRTTPAPSTTRLEQGLLPRAQQRRRGERRGTAASSSRNRTGQQQPAEGGGKDCKQLRTELGESNQCNHRICPSVSSFVGRERKRE